MNASPKSPQTTPPTDLPPTWDEIERSDWFQSADTLERKRIASFWAGELRKAAVAMPDYDPAKAGWIADATAHARERVDILEKAGGRIAQTGKLALRGAGAEGLYAGIEGAARGAANLATDLAQDVPGTELAGIDVNLERLKTRRRELLGGPPAFSTSASAESPPVSPVDDAQLAEIDRDIAGLETRKAAARENFAGPVKEYAGAVAETRERIREALPVDPEFAATLPGQIAQGLGQAAATLPLFAVPGVGPSATLGQLYQQGFDDAKAHGADEDTAHKAGLASLPAAALDVAADKLIIGKVLKPLRGKITVRDLAKDVLAASAAEGGTEGAQQVWQNHVAQALLGYDPDRLLDDQVLNSILVGAAVGGIVAGGGQAVANRAAPRAAEGTPLPATGPAEVTGSPAAGGSRASGDGKAADGVVFDDTGKTVPESPRTLAEQQRALVEGRQAVQMFPTGTGELALPDGMERLETDRGVFHFDPRRIEAERIRAASAAHRENEVLGLGPANKNDVLARVKAGEPWSLLVEQTPDGVEVKSAYVVPSTLEATRAIMEARKASENALVLQRADEVLARRDAANSAGREPEAAETSTGSESAAGGKLAANGGASGQPAAPGPGAAEDFDAMAREIVAARDRVAARPVEDFKSELGAVDAADLAIVGELGDYARRTDRPGEDFASWAHRMHETFGPKVGAYLPQAWDVVSAGKPVMDLAADGDPAKIDGAWTRALKFGRLFWEGSADVLKRGGYGDLAAAVKRHVDLAERNLGQGWGFVRPALDVFTGTRGLINTGVREQVRTEFAGYYRAKENGRADEAAGLLQAASPQTRELVAAAERLFAWTGYQMQRLGVRVLDRETGAWRPARNLGKDYWPRMLNEETEAVLRDPSTDPARWEQMRQELLENGNIEALAEADRFLRETMPRESAADFMANLELARSGKLPESWYEYDPLKVLPRFVARWSERAAQIEAFGQKAGEMGSDAFDRALARTRSDTARNYIMATREHAYRQWHGDPALRKALGNVTAATTGLFLGNPWSAARNLVGGVAQTVNQFGAVHSLESLRHVWGRIADAELAGAVKADVADLLFAGEGSDPLRRAVGVAMKAGGFGPAETFVRAHAWLTAKAYLRDAIATARAEPFGTKALQDRAFIERLRIDARALLAERMNGPLTESFLRGAVREGQGGYRYDQVPLFVDSPMGRFLFQFARWGTQAARFHALNTFGPAVLGDVVKTEEGGKPVERRVRTILPLLRAPLVAMGAGALTLALREAVLGIERNDAAWDEIWRTKDDDARRAFALALDRMLNDVIFAGTFGAVSDYGALLKDAATRNRFKNPVEPPAVGVLQAAGALAYKLAQQGELTREDCERFFSAVVSAYRVGSRMAYNFADQVGADWERAKLQRADRDKQFVRTAGYRFADDIGLEDNPYRSGWLPNVSERTPVYTRIEDALLLGDAFEANRLAAEYLAGVDRAKFRDARVALLASVRSRQPVKPGGSTDRDLQDAFLQWARLRLSDAEYRRVVGIQTRYLETAVRAQLMPPDNLPRWRRMANRPKPPAPRPNLNMAQMLESVGAALSDED